MSVDSARCQGCGQLPEMVFGSWWPHPPGASCRDAPAVDEHEAAFELDTAEERGVTTCQDGLHVFPSGGGRCKCGRDFLRNAPAPSPLALAPPWYLEK